MLRKLFAVFLLIFCSINISASAATSNQSLPEQNETTKVSPIKENVYTIEHLKEVKGYPANLVKITNVKMVLMKHNVLQVTFLQDFNSKKLQVGDIVSFSIKDGLKTVEGTQILPPNTQFLAQVKSIKKPQMWNRNAQILLLFDTVVLENGKAIPINALVYDEEGVLRKSFGATMSKAILWPVGLLGVGAGAGAGIGAALGSATIGCFAVGMPVGAAVGLGIGVVSPGQHYKAKAGKSIAIQLQEDLVITPEML